MASLTTASERPQLEDMLKDYRVQSAQCEVCTHPFVTKLFRVVERLSHKFALRRGRPDLAMDLSGELALRLVEVAERHRAKVAQSAADLMPAQLHHAHFMSDWVAGGRSVVSSLWQLAEFSWGDVDRRLMEEEIQIVASLKGLTVEQARIKVWADLSAETDRVRQLQDGGFIAEVRSRGAQQDDLDSLIEEGEEHEGRLHDALTVPTSASRASDDAYARALQDLPLDQDFSQFRTALRSPLRVATMVKAFEEFGDAMVGMKNAQNVLLGLNECTVWKAYWAMVRDRWEEFVDINLGDLAKKLGYGTKDKLNTVLNRAKDIWLNPPEDLPEDEPETRARKARFRALGARCMALALPTRWTLDKTPEQIQVWIDQAKQQLKDGKVNGAKHQPFQQYRSMIHQHIANHLPSSGATD